MSASPASPASLSSSTAATSPSRWRTLFSFPNPVNEFAARSVAGQVLILAIATEIWRTVFLFAALALGFLARVATGPTLSVFGQLATRVIAPRFGPARPTAGPPKRFAQAMGLTMSGAALICQLAGADTAAVVLVALIIVAATLESVFGLCLGCLVFGFLQRRGLIPAEVCEACATVGVRWGAVAS